LKKFAFDEELNIVVDDPTIPEINGKRLCDFPSKFIVHAPAVLSNYPNVDGLLRAAVWPYFFKKRGIGYWASGCERFAFPLLYAVVSNNADAAQLNAIKQGIESLKNEGGTAVKDNVKIETISNGAAGGDQVWRMFVNYWDAALAILIVGATLNVDTVSQGGAARALGEVHERVRNDLALADAEKLARTLERDLAQAILDMNAHHFDFAPICPQLFFDGVEEYPLIQQWHVEKGIIRLNQLLSAVSLPRLPRQIGDIFIPPGEALDLNVLEGRDVAALIAEAKAKLLARMAPVGSDEGAQNAPEGSEGSEASEGQPTEEEAAEAIPGALGAAEELPIKAGEEWKDTTDGHRIEVITVTKDSVYCVDRDAENPEKQFRWSKAHFLEICRKTKEAPESAAEDI
jgi:hypothetical protein